MREKAPQSPVFYGSAKAEHIPPKKEPTTIVESVKKAAYSWLDRMGPKGVERHFVDAHARVVNTLKPGQQKDTFTRELQAWRSIGEALGLTATVIDTGLIAFGLGTTARNWNKTEEATNDYQLFVRRTIADEHGTLINDKSLMTKLLLSVYDVRSTVTLKNGSKTSYKISEKRAKTLGHIFTKTPGVVATGALIAGGPAHWLAHKERRA